MTRLRKGPGTDVLEREYVFSVEEPSLTDIAAKYGLARSNVAAKCRTGGWAKKRADHLATLAAKTRELMADEWVEFEKANREKLLRVGAAYLDKFATALEAGEVKVTTRDMLGVAAMMRTFLSDGAAKPADDPRVVSDTGFDAAEARDVIAQFKQLMAGEKK